MNAKGSTAHIHMAGTMQTVIYASHHHPDSAFNPDLEKNITFFWLQQLIHSLSLLPHNTKDYCTLFVYFGVASPNSSAFADCNFASVHSSYTATSRATYSHDELKKMKINQTRHRFQKSPLGAHAFSLPKLKEVGKLRTVSHTWGLARRRRCPEKSRRRGRGEAVPTDDQHPSSTRATAPPLGCCWATGLLHRARWMPDHVDRAKGCDNAEEGRGCSPGKPPLFSSTTLMASKSAVAVVSCCQN